MDWWNISERCWGDTPVCATESKQHLGWCICKFDSTQRRNKGRTL